jgi:rhodanese-related sulfurtransferase
MKSRLIRAAGTIAALFILFAAHNLLASQFNGAAPPQGSAYSIPAAQLLQPEELNRMLHASGPNRPLVLQVGSHMLFAQAHITGSEYAGPGSQPEGLKLLRDRVGPLPRKTSIVLYCGCCPWNRCPNLEPAVSLLRNMGFTNAKALYLANNLGADWVDKGFPVESGR